MTTTGVLQKKMKEWEIYYNTSRRSIAGGRKNIQERIEEQIKKDRIRKSTSIKRNLSRND